MSDETKKYLTWLAILLALGVAAYLLSANIHSQQSGADAVRSGIQRIEEQQRNIDARLGKLETGLDKSIKTTERVAGNVSAATDAIGSVESRINSSTVRIESSQRAVETGERIIQGIRKNNELQNK